jgi:hypothetical protein
VLDTPGAEGVTRLLEMANMLTVDGQNSDKSDTEQHPSDILSAHGHYSFHARKHCNWDSDTMSELVRLIDSEFKTKSRDENKRSGNEFSERPHSEDVAPRACIPAQSSRLALLGNSSNDCSTSQGRAEPPTVD